MISSDLNTPILERLNHFIFRRNAIGIKIINHDILYILGNVVVRYVISVFTCALNLAMM